MIDDDDLDLVWIWDLAQFGGSRNRAPTANGVLDVGSFSPTRKVTSAETESGTRGGKPHLSTPNHQK